MKKTIKKTFVAMSGGVDSSVAASLLKQQGYGVVGVFLRLAPGCKEPERAARAVAKKIGIKFLVWDWREEFKKRIIDYFISEYAAGKTPNPCVVCNKLIKFSKFLKEAKMAGADRIATGHYIKKLKIENYKLKIAKDKSKDQSYFLYNLNQKILGKTLFPLGDFMKKEIKKMADDLRLPYLKKESQDICFLKGGHNEFLKKNLKLKKGKIITADEKIIGEHDGLPLYTIGQRRGFGKGGGVPYYVVYKNIRKNLLIVASKADEKKIYKKEAKIKNVNWISGKSPDCLETGFPSGNPVSKLLKARIRYRQPLQSCRIVDLPRRPATSTCHVEFIKPQRAITPGQSLVIYDGQTLLGGGIIK
ncbi:tRNA 2-thiouridine(34) synthase MnmA [Patescibacteria group bacterium]|nr:tRNA 2-thiouridine(34) synthase MnmA [Patescibacteria group bacterium]MBU4353566.1 tRNA 2-thiouridine(34) synthase MnmA [Patescibacteria group bacterium]MBU4476926.1 tRNA 2-thiouridine(34) synthase MnmA [Patescibacteria group bacterium]MCG2699054.1 tRNA 2-thiouridine(34) synthase MnmA [Candidatus Parcubacteria bacterium]